MGLEGDKALAGASWVPEMTARRIVGNSTERIFD